MRLKAAMNYPRLARGLLMCWLLAAGAATLIAAGSESYYLGQLRASSDADTFADVHDKWLTSARVKKSALAAFLCGLPVGVLSWIYGSKKGAPPRELESDS
jgi:hypothetical protein